MDLLIFLCGFLGSDDVVDSSKLCADLVNFISRNPSAACKVGELLARFGSEGILGEC